MPSSNPDLPPFEKLGAFYLGRTQVPAGGTGAEQPLLYDARDLTTHAVCVGMTGSGKTGLCLALVEEAALDGIPAIAIDPKGDLGNLLLTFPNLAPEDFRPWIDEASAAREGLDPDAYARRTADDWRKGLADWHQDGERIARLRATTDLAIYTPGHRAGRPLALVGAFEAPSPGTDDTARTERVAATAAGLLTLIDVDADPLTSKEHILLSRILADAWTEGRTLDMAGLIGRVQTPPFQMLGAMELATFFPEAERFELAERLNGLIAAPGFAAWREGDPLSIDGLLWRPDGQPRISILSIAHLNDRERMFLVTSVLTALIDWLRRQPGTPSLRAILYMDEIFGYCPPTANPPSKTPLLTLLKQARAFGLGVVLATQNPVDLDYRGLSNTGTWWVGRLQTERDRLRLIDGLEGAGSATGQAVDRKTLERTIAGLDKRVFLMNNVHENGPVVFKTRWALSYLRGPLTLREIAALTPRPTTPPASSTTPAAQPASHATPAEDRLWSPEPPSLPQEITARFLTASRPQPADSDLRYVPGLLGKVEARFVDAKARIDESRQVYYCARLDSDDPWPGAVRLESEPPSSPEPAPGSRFARLPDAARRSRSYAGWSKALRTDAGRTMTLDLLQCQDPPLISAPGELEGPFRARLREAARERRDAEVERLRTRYGKKVARLESALETAKERVGVQTSQYEQQKLQTVISLGAAALGALFGRKTSIGRTTTAARGAGRAARERGDVTRAQERVERLEDELAELEREAAADIDALGEPADPAAYELGVKSLKPRRSSIVVARLDVAWIPVWRRPDGSLVEGLDVWDA